MKKLKKSLSGFLKKEKIIADIFLFGSALKSKEAPNDIDIIVLFREKDYEKIEQIIYAMKKINEKLDIEPIVVDNMHQEPVYLSILHEGFSIRHMKPISQMMGLRAFIMVSYSLKDKTPSDKVRFAYALYGRKKGEGLLDKMNGRDAGKGSVLIPIEFQATARSFFAQWGVAAAEKRIFVKD